MVGFPLIASASHVPAFVARPAHYGRRRDRSVDSDMPPVACGGCTTDQGAYCVLGLRSALRFSNGLVGRLFEIRVREPAGYPAARQRSELSMKVTADGVEPSEE